MLIEAKGNMMAVKPKDPRAIIFHIAYAYAGLADEECDRCGVPFKFTISGNSKTVRQYTFRHCSRQMNPNLDKLNTIMTDRRTCPFYCRVELRNKEEHIDHMLHGHLMSDEDCLSKFLISKE